MIPSIPYCVRERPVVRPRIRMLVAGAVVLYATGALPLSAQWVAGAGGAISYSGGNVGIGTNNPLYKVHMKGNWVTLVWDDPLGSLTGGGLWRVGTGGPWNTWALQVNTAPAGDFTSALQPITVLGNGNIGIWTTNPQYRLAVEGAIGARDIIVTNAPWSDYVFRPGSRLRPLSEVNAYIEKHHHLPDIPTEAEVQEKGVSVGDMQAKLLAKIEELTLHMIRADERSKTLEQQNLELQERVARLENGTGAAAVAAR